VGVEIVGGRVCEATVGLAIAELGESDAVERGRGSGREISNFCLLSILSFKELMNSKARLTLSMAQ
jgi:DNA-binding GntR family transcriptional regulator